MGCDHEDPAILHVYPPNAEHGDAVIVGNREGLEELRRAIDVALNKTATIAHGVGWAETSCVDGEAYSSLVVRNDTCWQNVEWRRMQLPYTRGKDKTGELGLSKEIVERASKGLEGEA